ncbi:MAG TPA: YHS domain-containing protein [Xanthomonadaceae bacterium]|nr:YHS domain-containing protein [Xanthomonadaceae bacterium]
MADRWSRLEAGELALHVYPVCPMDVDPGRVRAKVEYDGMIYYFCSLICAESFERCGPRLLRTVSGPPD